MREEKKYLSKAVAQYLEKSEYVLLADFSRVTVSDVEGLRKALAKHDAEFHVVKNSALKAALEAFDLPDFSPVLNGPTAILVGGKDPSAVAKELVDFHKKNDSKCPIKGGALDGDRVLTPEEVTELSKLPSLGVLRAQLMGLLNQPAQQMVRVIQAVPQGVLNVMQAYSQKEEN